MTMRAVAFADLRSGVWGAALSAHPELPSFAVIAPEPGALLSAHVHPGTSPVDDWRIVGDELDLTVAPEPFKGEEPPTDAGGLDQLVAVRGVLRGSRPREVDGRGVRSERADEPGPRRFQLLRDVAAWFGPGEGFALIAVRPRRASGHGDEQVSATAFSAGHRLPVADPRLSTTYGERGQPVRTTFEMWFPDETEEEEAVQYPRRAAGEASQPGTDQTVGALDVALQPYRWRAEGREGAGVYLLARAR